MNFSKFYTQAGTKHTREGTKRTREGMKINYKK
jgi:hypothetical protein